MKHFISFDDASPGELTHLFELAFQLRKLRQSGIPQTHRLVNKTLAMIFEKPSLRTRVSFEQAINELGGVAIVLSDDEVGLGRREPAADVARVLNGMVHGIMARVFEHQKLVDLASHATIPVVNALSDTSHPCQALADAMTMMDEFGRNLRGRTLTFVGDGNNVARSLAELSARLGMNFVLACPKGFELDAHLLASLHKSAKGARIEQTNDPITAVKSADAIYTDTWVSMGQESEAAKRKAAFDGYQINRQLLAAAPPHAIVLHCLPAYRGCEITDEAMECAQSRVFPQAHNRLHAQKAVLAMLME